MLLINVSLTFDLVENVVRLKVGLLQFIQTRVEVRPEPGHLLEHQTATTIVLFRDARYENKDTRVKLHIRTLTLTAPMSPHRCPVWGQESALLQVPTTNM